jgi:(E)-4-hydroxy-3-methylbut-2-enyl-diphosphate synthase
MASYRVNIGPISIGGGSPIAIQSMCDTLTVNVSFTVNQIKRLEKLGCEIIRVAVPDQKSATALSLIKSQIKIPLVADIHFDYRLALASLEAGVDKIRINPGNIGSEEKLKEIIKRAQKKNAAIRIGVNAGSLEPSLLKKYGAPTAEALVESALKSVRFFEKQKFKNLVISLKSSSVSVTIEAYRLIAQKTNYPLHLGLTEAGPLIPGTVKSALALGTLLKEGIGDTIRVSLSEKPEKELAVAKEILKAAGRREGVEIIACPTCARTALNVKKTAQLLEKAFSMDPRPLKIAVMGCLVNGPGEAKEADVGVCGLEEGSKEVMLFARGKLLGKINQEKVVEEIKKLIA